MQQSESLVISDSKTLSVRSSAQGRGQEVALFVDCWPGGSKEGDVLLIVHGLGEHGGRYRHLPKLLGEEFSRFYSMDQRGHGRSGGLRGYSPHFEQLAQDLKRVASEVQAKEEGKRLFLLAHSFGGLVALSLLLKEKKLPFAGAILSAPLLQVKMRVPRWKILLGEVLGRTLSRIQLSNEVNPSHLSHDPVVVAEYVNDRLVHQKITPRLYVDMTAAMQWIRSQTSGLSCPVLFLLPGKDLVVDSKATLEFFRNLKYRDKELREYPGMYHEVLNEVDKEQVAKDIRQWLKKTRTLKA
ncbi:MAG: lysophospholipase [Bdellovibrionota bacterium]